GASSKTKTHPQFTVVTGERVRDIELRLIPLGSIAGRVLDADGDPVSKAMVSAMGWSYPNGKKTLKAYGGGTTDDRGDFRISGLAPGAYYLHCAPNPITWHPLSSSLRMLGPSPVRDLGETFYPASVEVASATALNLTAGGDLRGLTILMRPQQSYTLRLTVAPTASGP